MEPENPDERPESPKKKIRPSSTTNSEMVNSDSLDATDAAQLSDNLMNGTAPTRRGREAEAVASRARNDSTANENDQASIQEEVVSSSENTVHSKQNLPNSTEGNADSPTNEAEDLSNHGAAPSRDNEAEREEL